MIALQAPSGGRSRGDAGRRGSGGRQEDHGPCRGGVCAVLPHHPAGPVGQRRARHPRLAPGRRGSHRHVHQAAVRLTTLRDGTGQTALSAAPSGWFARSKAHILGLGRNRVWRRRLPTLTVSTIERSSARVGGTMLDDPGVDALVQQWTADNARDAKNDEITRIASQWLADSPIPPPTALPRIPGQRGGGGAWATGD